MNESDIRDFDWLICLLKVSKISTCITSRVFSKLLRSNYLPRLSSFQRVWYLLFSLRRDTGGLGNVSWPRGRRSGRSGASVELLLARRKHNEGARIVFGKWSEGTGGWTRGRGRGDWQTSLMRVPDENSANNPTILALSLASNEEPRNSLPLQNFRRLRRYSSVFFNFC